MREAVFTIQNKDQEKSFGIPSVLSEEAITVFCLRFVEIFQFILSDSIDNIKLNLEAFSNNYHRFLGEWPLQKGLDHRL